ncbi:MAG: DUF1302 family protein [Aliiglaciecola sp.]|uniref:DUF1302 family protein n=1 Tax=Aliiglaciecola sp. TaxID=1872441 RepID=UPI003297440C
MNSILLKISTSLSKAVFISLSVFVCQINFTLAQNAATVIQVDYRLGFNLHDAQRQLSRLSITTDTDYRINRNWSLQLDLRAEVADDEVGLGTVNTYSSVNKPIIDNQQSRFEIDRAYVQWRERAHSFTLGKQVTPWGVLDGIQITDRFDPVRRRDFVLTDVRPDRIARWGARWRNKVGQFKLDGSFAFDGTVSQQAEVNTVFFTRSTRFTGGMNIATTPITVMGETRNASLEQSTIGLRVSRSLGSGELSLLSFRGPDTDPLLSLTQQQSINEPGVVELKYLRRTLYGATYDLSLGETVLRGEIAYIPDQSINIISEVPLQSARTKRLLAGVGLDWNAPNQWFVNGQLALDYISSEGHSLVRPATDIILTLRAQRTFISGRLLFKGEILGTLNDKDGVLRPELAFEYSDRLKLRSGIDYLFGDENSQFGQFRDNSRLWLAATYTF